MWGIPLDVVHVTRSDGRPGRNEAGIRHHAGRLDRSEIEYVNGMPVTKAARTAVEVTTITTVEPALVTINGMLHDKLFNKQEFAAEVARLKHWPDTLTATLVERLCDGRIPSVAESRTLHLCWSQHLPRPEPQIPIRDERGWVFAYVDFGWEDEGVFLEFDGRLKYELFRRENETLAEYLLREKRREEQICQLTGWVCIRIAWADLENPRANCPAHPPHPGQPPTPARRLTPRASLGVPERNFGQQVTVSPDIRGIRAM